MLWKVKVMAKVWEAMKLVPKLNQQGKRNTHSDTIVRHKMVENVFNLIQRMMKIYMYKYIHKTIGFSFQVSWNLITNHPNAT